MEEATRGEQTRRAILEAAVARFGRDGYRSTAVTAIARDAGVGPTAPYLYFPTKDALFLAAADADIASVVEESVARVLDEGDDSYSVHPADEEWPAVTMAAALESLECHGLARRILAGLEPNAAARLQNTPALLEAGKLLATSLAVGQQSGRVRTDVTADDLAAGLVGIFLALLASGIRFGLDNDSDRFDAILRTLHASVVPGN